MVWWQSGPMHGIANPENRQFESDSHFQRNYMDVIPGYHAKSRDICEWVIQNYSHVTDNMTVVAWVNACRQHLQQLN